MMVKQIKHEHYMVLRLLARKSIRLIMIAESTDSGCNEDNGVTFHFFRKKHRAKRKMSFPYEYFKAK